MKFFAYLFFVLIPVLLNGQATVPAVTRLSQLRDVQLTSPTDGQTLVLSAGKWVNGAGSSGITTGANGGTGVANTGKTITLGASLTTTGAGAPSLAFPSGTATYTFPTSTATLARTDAAQTFTGNQVITGTLASADVTISSSSTNGTALYIQNLSNNRNWSIGVAGSANLATPPLPSGTFYWYDATSAAVRMLISAAGIVTINSDIKFAGTNSTGSGSASLGSNSPATTNTAPYTWIRAISSDGSTVWIPAWK